MSLFTTSQLANREHGDLGSWGLEWLCPLCMEMACSVKFYVVRCYFGLQHLPKDMLIGLPKMSIVHEDVCDCALHWTGTVPNISPTSCLVSPCANSCQLTFFHTCKWCVQFATNSAPDPDTFAELPGWLIKLSTILYGITLSFSSPLNNNDFNLNNKYLLHFTDIKLSLINTVVTD